MWAISRQGAFEQGGSLVLLSGHGEVGLGQQSAGLLQTLAEKAHHSVNSRSWQGFGCVSPAAAGAVAVTTDVEESTIIVFQPQESKAGCGGAVGSLEPWSDALAGSVRRDRVPEVSKGSGVAGVSPGSSLLVLLGLLLPGCTSVGLLAMTTPRLGGW